jgi:type IV pilus assembly protein PilF
MFSTIDSLRRRPLALMVLALAILCSPARADEKKEARKQVEFGIEVAKQGLWQEAIFRWKKAVELDPNNASARNNLGVAYEQAGEFELAEEEYERALELDSSSVYIRQNYELFREAYEKRKRKEGRDRGSS